MKGTAAYLMYKTGTFNHGQEPCLSLLRSLEHVRNLSLIFR
uniref:Inner membrane protein forms channel for type IV secretion of T-DNA complex (VirB10) n=1 Tax=Escherichia coli TaxID=562 RepID=A0A2K9UZN9_ECOLX|nr:Inner membrane protein forms channel for type IV secretion of T-DNA complex (VirB10) [Escherichia coli]